MTAEFIWIFAQRQGGGRVLMNHSAIHFEIVVRVRVLMCGLEKRKKWLGLLFLNRWSIRDVLPTDRDSKDH
jgi:hypothetical protein